MIYDTQEYEFDRALKFDEEEASFITFAEEKRLDDINRADDMNKELA